MGTKKLAGKKWLNNAPVLGRQVGQREWLAVTTKDWDIQIPKDVLACRDQKLAPVS